MRHVDKKKEKILETFQMIEDNVLRMKKLNNTFQEIGLNFSKIIKRYEDLNNAWTDLLINGCQNPTHADLYRIQKYGKYILEATDICIDSLMLLIDSVNDSEHPINLEDNEYIRGIEEITNLISFPKKTNLIERRNPMLDVTLTQLLEEYDSIISEFDEITEKLKKMTKTMTCEDMNSVLEIFFESREMAFLFQKVVDEIKENEDELKHKDEYIITLKEINAHLNEKKEILKNEMKRIS